MKVKLLPMLFLFICQLCFSQNEELFQGTVFNQNIPIQGVDVINLSTKAQTITDQKGNFSIVAKIDDSLVFISKDYELKKLLVDKKLYDKKLYSVVMNLKPEELEEVVITKIGASAFILKGDKKYEQGIRDQMASNTASYSQSTGVYDGTIPNGMDFIQIGMKILRLFKKEKEPTKEALPEIEFAILAKNTCDQKFYLETLKLKPDEIDLFLQFCDVDPKSKKVAKDNNILSMMDFLTIKNQEFQKLQEEVMR